jgi:hypothetical protein
MRQTTDTILMVRPKNFAYNSDTAKNNLFQNKEGSENTNEIKKKAVEEFDQFVQVLGNAEVKVLVIDDLEEPELPDSVFPNNWITFHEPGWIITYPMCAEIRSKERREDIVDKISQEFNLVKRYSFEYYEEEKMYLEGTGSMILDRVNKIVYACLSARTNPQLLDKWTVLNNYRSVHFHAVGESGVAIYHTNVMMAMGEKFVIICLDTVKNVEEKKKLIQSFQQTNKTIIEISISQMNSFAGNMLEVRGGHKNYTVMSTQAYESLDSNQIETIEKFTQILHSDIKTIEKYGGGSVRCMMAEIFYPDMH